MSAYGHISVNVNQSEFTSSFADLQHVIEKVTHVGLRGKLDTILNVTPPLKKKKDQLADRQ